ncbi:hypothetical protein PMAYCL1PPCAC_13993, partial [Pristionchus mayeri]
LLQAFKFASRSSDVLVPITSRVFDVPSLIFKNSDLPYIRSALTSVNFERKKYLRFENTDEISIRLLMHGLIESLHLTLNHLTEGRTDAYETALATIEKWKRKTSEFSNHSTDHLVSLFSRAFESMVIIVR